MTVDGEGIGPGGGDTVPGAGGPADAATVGVTASGSAPTWGDPGRDPDETLTNPESLAFLALFAPAVEEGELGRLGPYRVVGLLGVGGMGAVFRAIDPRLRRPVALKTLRPDRARDPAARKRFLREARAAAALEHDHVVAIHEVNEDRGVPYLVMPLLAGRTLEDRLKAEGRLPIAEVLRIGREVAEGLAAAHDRGLIHRDIKPSNLWLEGARARVKILDFGLARAEEADGSDEDRTEAGMILGTPAFMAPEQARGGPVDERSDLFSLGCVLYSMATGASPFRRPTPLATLDALLHEEPAPPRDPVPPAFRDLLSRLLAKDPAHRPATAGAVAEALAGLERALPDGPRTPRVGPRRSAALAAGLVALAIAAALLGARLAAHRRRAAGGGDRAPAAEASRPADAPAAGEPPRGSLKGAAPPAPAPRRSPGDLWTSGGDTRALHGADAAAYRAWLDRSRADGYLPVFVNAHDAGGTPRFAALAVRDPAAIGWEAPIDPRLDDYEETFRAHRAGGFRPLAVSGYRNGEGVGYASIWLPQPAAAPWFSWSTLTPGQYQVHLDAMFKEGFRVSFLAGYEFRGGPLLASIFVSDGAPARACHGFDADGFRKFLEAHRAEGLRPETAATYPEGGAIRFSAAMIPNAPARGWSVDLDLTAGDYARKLARRAAVGTRPAILSGYWDGAQSRYLVVWVADRPGDPPADGEAREGPGDPGPGEDRAAPGRAG